MRLLDKFKGLIVGYRYRIFLVVEIVMVAIGAYVAYVTVYGYEIIVRAVLGLTVLYLLYREYVLLKTMGNKSFGVKFEFPKDIKYFVIDFFVVIVMIWAGVQVLDLIRYLIYIFTNG